MSENSYTPGAPVRPALARRTVIGGAAAAAWSLPVIATAVGVPAAVASGGRSITFDFAALFLALRHSDSLSVLASITNNGPDSVSDVAVLTLTGIPAAAVDVTFDRTATQYEAPAGSNTADTPVQNASFTLGTPGNGGSSTLSSSGALTLAPGATIYLFFSLAWRAENRDTGAFLIFGHLTFGSGTITKPDDSVTVTYENDPA